MEEIKETSVDPTITVTKTGTIDVGGEWVSPEISLAMRGHTVDMVTDNNVRFETEEE